MVNSIQVLHLDNEPDFVETSTAFLEREIKEIEVISATNVSDALDLLDGRNVDCVISDYDMPGQTGIDFLEAVRNQYSELPFILFTGKGSEEVASDAIRSGVTDYLQKTRGTEQYQLLANRITEAIEHRRTKTNYQEIFEKTPDGIVIHDVEDGTFIDMNQKYVEMFGYDSREEFLDAGFEAIHRGEPPYTVEAAGKQVQRAIEAGPQTFEWPGVRKDGSEFWAEVHLAPVDLDGHERILASVRDVTERRQYQEELELQDERFRYLEEVADIGYWEFDVETGDSPVVTASDGVYLLHDLPREAEFNLETGIEYYHPEDQPRLRAAIERAVTQGESYDLTARLITESGRERWVHTVGEPVMNGGDVKMVRGVIQDITEQRKLETQLEEVYDRITDAFYALDENFRFTHVNDRTEDLMQASAEELLGNSLWEMYPEAAESDVIWDALQTAMDEQIPNSFDIYYDPLDFHAEATVYPSESGISVFFRDITEQKEYERQLEQQNERLDAFTSLVSHDLQNPLNVARGRLELACEECDNEHLDDVARALERMEALIDDMLALAREGDDVGDVETVNVADVADECWENLSTTEASITIENDLTIRGDRSRLQQLVENLFRNATEHGGKDVTVTVGAVDDGFYVEDDGPGIPENEGDTVFEAGYSTGEEGTGFGLSIVEQVAQAHGWDIRVTDGSDGGARFEITGVETTRVAGSDER